MMMLILRVAMASVVALVALAIAGCTTSGTPVATPTSSPSPPPQISVVEPAAIFGGDCSLLFSDDAIARIAGDTVHPVPFTDSNGTAVPRSVLFRQLGSIHCAWAGDDGTILLAVQHGDPNPDGFSHECRRTDTGETAEDPGDCVVDVVAHGVAISGLVHWPSQKKSRVVATSLSDYFNRAELSPGPVPDVPTDAWDSPVACGDIGPLTVEGRPAEIVRYEPDTVPATLPIDDELAQLYSAYGCYLSFTDALGAVGDAHFTATGGGAWLYADEVTAMRADGDVEETDLPGFDRVARMQDGERRRYALVSGKNYLSVTILGETSDVLILSAIRDNLDALASYGISVGSHPLLTRGSARFSRHSW